MVKYGFYKTYLKNVLLNYKLIEPLAARMSIVSMIKFYFLKKIAISCKYFSERLQLIDHKKKVVSVFSLKGHSFSGLNRIIFVI